MGKAQKLIQRISNMYQFLNPDLEQAEKIYNKKIVDGLIKLEVYYQEHLEIVNEIQYAMKSIFKELNVIENHVTYLNSIKSLRVESIAQKSVDQGFEKTWHKEIAVIQAFIKDEDFAHKVL